MARTILAIAMLIVSLGFASWLLVAHCRFFSPEPIVDSCPPTKWQLS